jgi:hypothetical protein
MERSLTPGAQRGHKPPFTCVVGQTFKRRLRPVTGHPIVRDERSFIGLSRHWDGLGSTSAMWQIADGDSGKQADGSFLHR